MTPVTIGDQKFVNDPDKGWIDSKTKQPADKGLIRLLDSLVIDEPVLKKLRTKIDTSVEPVTINGQKFVYDVNQGWIDAKTKVRAADSLQLVLNKATKPEAEVPATLGIAAQAGLQKTKAKAKPTQKKTGGGTLVKNKASVNINKPLVAMINQLASIDGYLKQQLQNKQLVAANELAQIKESAIEATDTAVPDLSAPEDEQKDAEKESNALEIAGATALAAAIAYQFDPVKQAVNTVIEFGSGVAEFVGEAVSSLNSVLSWLNGTQSESAQTSNTTPVSDTSPGWFARDNGGGETLMQRSTTNVPTAAPRQATPQQTDTAPGWFARSQGGGFAFGQTMPTPSLSASTSSGSSRSPSFTLSASTGSGPVATTPSSTQQSSLPRTTWPYSQPTMLMQQPDTAPGWFARSQGGGFAVPQQQTGAIPQGNIVALGRYLQQSGIGISEHPAFGGVGRHSTNSRHYRGQAIDLNIVPGRDADNPQAAARFDALKPQLEAAGYSVLWRTAGHYDHMHVSVGGPEGVAGFGGGESPMAEAVDTVTNVLSSAKNIFGAAGGALVGADRYETRPITTTDEQLFARIVRTAAIERTSAMADSRTPSPPPPVAPRSPPNINANKNSPVVQTQATTTDMSSVGYYLERFGFAPAESELAR